MKRVEIIEVRWEFGGINYDTPKKAAEAEIEYVLEGHHSYTGSDGHVAEAILDNRDSLMDIFKRLWDAENGRK